MPQAFENPLVPVEPGDGDPAEHVENGPFFRVGFQAGSIRVDAGQAEVSYPTVDPLMDNPTDLSKASPTQLQPGEAPLEELDPFAVSHRGILSVRSIRPRPTEVPSRARRAQ